MAKKAKLKTIVVRVSRKKWMRGENGSESALLVDGEGPNNGKMCCLGFASLACGLKKADIRGISMPSEVESKLPNAFYRFIIEVPDAGMFNVDNDITHRLAKVNDDDSITDKVRETRLKASGLKLGIKFVFVP